MIAGIVRHRFEHDTILLQHVPVQRFEPQAIHEPPQIALPAADLAYPPEIDLTRSGIDRRHEADDTESAARPGFHAVGNLQAHPLGAGAAELDPIEVHVALVLFLAYESGTGRDDAQARSAVAARHRVRAGVQIGSVHRVHHVVDGIAVVATPCRDAQHGGEAVVGQWLRRRQLGRLLVQGVAEPGEDGPPDFAAVIAAHRRPADQRAGLDRRDVEDRSVGADFDTVVPASQPVAEVPAERQACAAVGTAVFQCMRNAVAVAPDHDALAEPDDPERILADLPTRSDRVPEVAQPLLQKRGGIGTYRRFVRHRHPPSSLPGLGSFL